MDNEKDLLIASVARLYSIGIDLEAARDRLRQLVEQGVPYNSAEMKQTVQDFKELDRQWKELEKQHLELRDKVTKDRRLKNRTQYKILTWKAGIYVVLMLPGGQ